MKAYSYNGERFGYYGYDASGERMYKMDINYIGVFTNEYEQISENWEMGKMMLYPNGYLNMNQNGEYTKHYYAEALRIASKIGSGFSGNLCDSVSQIENDYPGYLGDRMSEQYSAMINEMYEAAVLPSPTGYLTFVNPYPDFCNIGFGGQETGLFFYHVDHLGSTGMVTDINANIQQGFLYAPFGEILFEQNLSWESDRIPKYSFNAKELDEENGMYYYSARYYAPPTFISRDPKFEQYFWLSPYCAFANNPLKYSDPTGMDFDEAQDKKYIQPMEKDIQNKIDGLKKQMSGLKEGSDEYNRLNDHVTELGNALTEISALRNDKDNLYLINFNGLGFNKEAGGDDSYHDAAGSLTYGGTNANGQNVININIKGQYIGTSGIMLHEFKHADQYRTGDLGFYVNSTGRQVGSVPFYAFLFASNIPCRESKK